MKILVCISSVPDTTAKINFTPDNKEFVSSGVTFILNPYDEIALSKSSDAALYRAKDRGRNRVELFYPTPSVE